MMTSVYVDDDKEPATKALLFLVHLLQLKEHITLQRCTVNKRSCRGNSCSKIGTSGSLQDCSLEPWQKGQPVYQEECENHGLCWKKNLCRKPFLIRDETRALPVIIYAGLCTVARQLVKLASKIHPGMNCSSLLGFKETCLKSHAEASIWTRFCEIEMIESIQELKNEKENCLDSYQLPKALKQLEQELQMPKHLPNASKYFGRGQKKWKSVLEEMSFNGICAEERSGIDESESSLLSPANAKSFSDRRSPYVCDFYLTLADVLLFAELHHVLSLQWCEVLQRQFQKCCPLLTAWLERLQHRPDFALAMTCTSMPMIQFNIDFIPSCISESNNDISLDTEPVSKQSTKQRRRGSYQVVDAKLSKLLERTKGNGYLMSFLKESADNKDIDWPSMPSGLDPAEGELNPARAVRKRHQITNMLTTVELVAKPGDVIVDFCAGGGHVGIVVAYFFPHCQVILVENKEDSIARAANRIHTLQLANITVCQSNVDYFSGVFNIGMALHACGLATDLVLQLCLRQRASFVVCPCCYGSMKPMNDISYPKSSCFAENQIDANDYELLAHGADMVTWDFQSEKSQIGRLCMKLIDSDRSAHMQECGYEASFSVMRPEDCSPKNHLLVGTLA